MTLAGDWPLAALWIQSANWIFTGVSTTGLLQDVEQGQEVVIKVSLGR